MGYIIFLLAIVMIVEVMSNPSRAVAARDHTDDDDYDDDDSIECYCQKGPSTYQELVDNEKPQSGWTNCYLTGNNPSSGTCFNTTCPGGEWIVSNRYERGEVQFNTATAADCISTCTALGGDFNIANMPAHCGAFADDDDYDVPNCPALDGVISKMSSGAWMSFDDSMVKSCGRRASHTVTSFMTDAKQTGKGLRLMFWITVDQFYPRAATEFAVTVTEKRSRESHTITVPAYAVANPDSLLEFCTSGLDPEPPHYGSYGLFQRNDEGGTDAFVEIPVPSFSNWGRGTYTVTIQPDGGNQCAMVKGMKPRRLRADGSVPAPVDSDDDDDDDDVQSVGKDHHAFWH